MSSKNKLKESNKIMFYGTNKPSMFTVKGDIGSLFHNKKTLEFRGLDKKVNLSSAEEVKMVTKRLKPTDFLVQWVVVTLLVYVNTLITGASPLIAPVYGLLALPLIVVFARFGGNKILAISYREKNNLKEVYLSNYRGRTESFVKEYLNKS